MDEDWNQRYIDSNAPWDSGVPSQHLKSLLAEGFIKPCRMLEIGCGTGTNAIFLAQSGFDVTAVDIAEEAVRRAKVKAEEIGVKVKFIQADVTALPDVGPPFPFVFDRGTYHILRSINLAGFQSMLAQVVAPGGYYAVCAGNANEDAPPEKGPPRVGASELCEELEEHSFDLVRLAESNFHGVRIDGEEVEPLAWVGLFRRRQEKRNQGDPTAGGEGFVQGLRGVRYQVADVSRSVDFYTKHLGFNLDQQHLPAFAQVSIRDLKLILSGPGASGSRKMPDGRDQEPGGWNRIVLQVDHLPSRIESLKKAGLHFRNEMEAGPGGKQIQLEDPDGNPIELFEPSG